MTKSLLLSLLITGSAYAACSVSSPTSGATVSGVVTWTASLTSLPSTANVDWVFDDFRVIGHVTAAPWSLVNYNTGWNLDGPGNVKIIVRDATGANICTSADVPFTTSNFGMGVTLNSCTGCVTSFTSIPTVSGTFYVDISGNFSVQNSNDSIDGINALAQTGGGGGYPTAGNRLAFDSTQLPNGIHSFGWETNCIYSSASCGMPNVATTGNVPRAFVGGEFNVNNPTGTVAAVLPNITTITMAPGDTFQLSANLLTDVLNGTTTTSSCGTLGLPGSGARCQIVQDNACLFPIQFNPQWPSQCVAGITPLGASYTSSITPSIPNTTTLGTLQGNNYVTISSTGLMTASSNVGLSYISIIDTTSGRVSQPITVEVKASKQVPHYGTCGALYTSYHSGGSCPSFLLSSVENYAAVGNAFSWPEYVNGGLTAFEGQYHQFPRNTGTNYTTFDQWYAQWNASYWTPIQAALAGMAGLSMVIRSDNTDAPPVYQADQIEVQQGPSAPTPLGGGTYGTVTGGKCGSLTVAAGVTHCDSVGFELDNLALTNRIAMHHVMDEADNGHNLWFNFAAVYPMVTADGSTRGVTKVVVSGCPGACQAIFYSQGPYNQYGGMTRIGGNPGYNTVVSGATNSFLNGQWTSTVNGYYCTKWNALLQYGGSPWPDRRCGDYSGAGCTQCSSSYEDTWVAVPCGITSTVPAPSAWPNTTGWGPGSCTSTAGGAGLKGGSACDATCNGTYTVSTDPGLNVGMWGPGPCGAGCIPGYDGETARNDMYTSWISKFQAHSIPTTWCTRAVADFTTDLGYSYNPATADGFCSYITLGDNPTQPWGRTFWEYYQVNYSTKWGQYFHSSTPSTACCQWRRDGKSFSTTRQGVPAVILLGVNAETFNLGGRFPGCSNQMVSCVNQSGAMANGIFTFTGPHNIPAQVGSIAEIKGLLGVTHVYVAPCTGLAACSSPSTQVLVYGTGLAVGTPSSTGTLTIMNGTYQGNSYPIPGWAGACYEAYFSSTTHLPPDVTRGTVMQISGSSGCDGTYALESWQVGGAGQCVTFGYCPKFGVISTSTASGQTLEINDDYGVMNPLYDFNNTGNGRFGGGGESGYELWTAAQGYQLKLYQVNNLSDRATLWSSAWINDQVIGGFQQTPVAASSGEQPSLMNRWHSISQGLRFANRLAPMLLQTMAPAPVIGPGLPWIATEMQTSTYGNLLTTWNTSEIPITATFNLGTACQVGSNPISVYHASFPHATTELLTGTQTTVTYTWDPGEAIVFGCHSGSASFVNPYSISYTPPTNTVHTVVTAAHGNYSAPLALHFQTNSTGNAGADRRTICSSSPCNVNLDTSVSNVYYNLTYLDGSNNVLGASSSPLEIPQGGGGTCVITTGSPLSAGTVATSVSQTIASSGCTAPLTWSVSSGTLPAGLSLVSSTGVISGVPTTAGTSSFTISLVDANNNNTSQAYSWTINSGGGSGGSLVQQTTCSATSGTSVSCTLTSAPAAKDGLVLTWGSNPNNATISTVSGGGVTWARLAGSNTNRDTEIWCGASSSGIGTTISITTNATCSGSGCLATVLEFSGFGCNVDQAPSGVSGTSNSPATPSITDISANDLILAVSRDADTGNLVSGPTNSFTAMHSPVTTDAYNSAYRLVNGTGAYSTAWTISSSQPWDAAIVSLSGACQITTVSPLPQRTAGTTISQTIGTNGCVSPTFAVSGSLPNGLSLNPSTGVISGTATTAGTFNPTISVTDANGNPSQVYSWTINAALAIQTSSPLPAAGSGTSYSQQLTATGGTGTLSWSITSGTLSGSGLSLTAAGLVSGTALSPSATYNFTATATDSLGVTSSKTFSISVTTAPTITSTSPLPGASIGTAYSFPFAAAGDTPITWSATSLPSWAAFNSSTGVLSGTPNAAGVSNINVSANNASGSTGPTAFSLTVNAGPAIQTTSPLPSAFVGVPYLLQLTATGGKGTLSWSISAGTLTGSGLSMNSSGLISGTPMTPAALYSFTVTVTDSVGANGNTSFQVQVTPPTPGPGSSARNTNAAGSVKLQ